MVSLHLEKPMYILSLRNVPIVLPLKWFWHLSCWWWPFLILSIKIMNHSSFYTSLLDQCCNVLGFVCICSVSSSSTLQIFWDPSHLWWLLCLPAYLLCHFPWLPLVQDSIYINRSLCRWIMNIDTCHSRLPIPLSDFSILKASVMSLLLSDFSILKASCSHVSLTLLYSSLVKKKRKKGSFAHIPQSCQVSFLWSNCRHIREWSMWGV